MYTTFLIKIKNAQTAGKDRVKTPFSNFDMAIAELLVSSSYIESATKKGRMPKRVIEVHLKTSAGEGMHGVKFLSTPSHSIYRGHRELRAMRSTRGGMIIMSTSQGIMRARDAIQKKVGGKLLCEVW